jgi:hypothetical protein
MSFPNVSVRNRTSGGQVITGTSAVTGSFASIDVMTDAKFNVLTGNITGAANTTEANAAIIKAGTTLDGNFSAITLHSGTVIAYNK